mgnify:CR=1 FL=1
MSARIIVCGSRTWDDFDTVAVELRLLADRWRHDSSGLPRDVTIVHGACPTGADKLADDWCAKAGIAKVERHPADWDSHGKGAGFVRNRKMAELGAVLCLAFWDGVSKGTLDMITQATRRGIPVRIVPKGTR